VGAGAGPGGRAVTAGAPSRVDNPFFARIWPVVANHEAKTVQALRRENLAGVSGRVLEVGAGVGTNFAFYPETVTEVVAVEPEPRLRDRAGLAAAEAPVPVTVTGEMMEQFSLDIHAEPFDVVLCSLVLCSVSEPVTALRHLYSLLRPGGQLRYLEHVASAGTRGQWQRLLDATLWPRLFGNCHTHRDVERSIIEAGFQVVTSRREWTLPAWTPMPVSELALGRALRP
jgi:SAM-dependent methyltransferase